MKKAKYLLCLSILFITCKKDKVAESGIVICSQVWMDKNLDVSTYRNGDPIPQIVDYNDWINATAGAWCWYKNDTANAALGKLYNWHAVNDPRGLAPEGWRIPGEQDWITLQDYTYTAINKTFLNPEYSSQRFKALLGTIFGLGNFSSTGRYIDLDFEPEAGFAGNYPLYALPELEIQCWTNHPECKAASVDWFNFYFPVFPKQTGLPVRCIKD